MSVCGWLTVASAGEFVAFFPPCGAHAPGCLPAGAAPGGHRKIVIKVRAFGSAVQEALGLKTGDKEVR